MFHVIRVPPDFQDGVDVNADCYSLSFSACSRWSDVISGTMGLLRLEFLQTPVTYSKLQTGSNSLGMLLLIQVLGIWKRGCQGSDSVRHWENPLISQSANCAWMQTFSLARCFRQSDINEDQAGRVCLTMPLGMRGRMPQHWILGVGMLCHHRSSWHFLVQIEQWTTVDVVLLSANTSTAHLFAAR